MQYILQADAKTWERFPPDCKFPHLQYDFAMNAIRDAKQSDVKDIASLWHESWHDAHSLIVPKELVQIRTLESFVVRTQRNLANLRVAGDSGVGGICAIKGDELFQLFVSKNSRGTGLAKMLLADAEDRLSSNGIARAWLGCAIGNDRAAKFYSKCGWELTQSMIDELETTDGTYSLKVWKFEKQLT